MEIISKSTRGKDAIKKLDLYLSTGVKEYWLVNPINQEVTVYLFENNELSRNATSGAGKPLFHTLSPAWKRIWNKYSSKSSCD